MHLSLVSSLDSQCRAAATAMVGQGHRDSVLVLHDLLPDGSVLRRIHFRGRLIERQERRLEHGCLSCTVRLDVIPTVREFLRAGCPHLTLGLPPGVAAAQVLEELGLGGLEGLRVDNLLVAVDPLELEEQIWDARTLYEAGFTALRGDDRIGGEFLVGEFALSDTVLAVPGMSSLLSEPDDERSPKREPWMQGVRLLGHLAPHATVLEPEDDFLPGCHDHREAFSRSRPGSVRVPVLDDPGDFRTVLHRLDRPLHPVRFHESLPLMAQGVHWLRGNLRIAGAGAEPVALQGVGPRVWMEPAQAAPPAALLAGAADRSGVVAVTGRAEDVDQAELTRLLDHCSLRDDELRLDHSRFPDTFGLAGPFSTNSE
ncbi:GTP-binding protein [Arthrobacter sp. NPDC090010]|uniref:GTP-binding protein n=1 Tax=Arthrobacter sp. NPDC090010 TaxID=3363942 RepID=UPI0038092B96